MRTTVLAAAALAAVAGVVRAETPLERGEYLVRVVAACGNCHTPFAADGAPDMARELGGRLVEKVPAFDAYAPNITPHPEDGVGAWTDAELARAIREGIRPDGSLIGPPMPIGLYRGLSDDDLAAMVAFLRTLPPVAGVQPRSEYRIPLPPSYGPPVEGVAAPDPSDEIAYGAYLAGPVAHCIECHSPMGEAGADWAARPGAGGFEFHGPWGISVAPNLTPHEDAIARWTDEELAAMVRTGLRPDGTPMLPPMGYPYYAAMRDSDLKAIISYLRSLPPLPMFGG